MSKKKQPAAQKRRMDALVLTVLGYEKSLREEHASSPGVTKCDALYSFIRLFANGGIDVRPYETAADMLQACYKNIQYGCSGRQNWNLFLNRYSKINDLFSMFKARSTDATAPYLPAKQLATEQCLTIMQTTKTTTEPNIIDLYGLLVPADKVVTRDVSNEMTDKKRPRSKKEAGSQGSVEYGRVLREEKNIKAALRNEMEAFSKEVGHVASFIKAEFRHHPILKSDASESKSQLLSFQSSLSLSQKLNSDHLIDTVTAIIIYPAEPFIAASMMNKLNGMTTKLRQLRQKIQDKREELTECQKRIVVLESSRAHCPAAFIEAGDTRISECDSDRFQSTIFDVTTSPQSLPAPAFDRNDVWMWCFSAESVLDEHRRMYNDCVSGPLIPRFIPPAGFTPLDMFRRQCAPPVKLTAENFSHDTAIEIIVVTLMGDTSDGNETVYLNNIAQSALDACASLPAGKKFVTWRLNSSGYYAENPTFKDDEKALRRSIVAWQMRHSELCANGYNSGFQSTWSRLVADPNLYSGISVSIVLEPYRLVSKADWGTPSLLDWIVNTVHTWAVRLRTYAPHGFNVMCNNRYNRDMALRVYPGLWSPHALNYMLLLNDYRSKFDASIRACITGVRPPLIALHQIMSAFCGQQYILLPSLLKIASSNASTAAELLALEQAQRGDVLEKVVGMKTSVGALMAQMQASAVVLKQSVSTGFDFVFEDAFCSSAMTKHNLRQEKFREKMTKEIEDLLGNKEKTGVFGYGDALFFQTDVLNFIREIETMCSSATVLFGRISGDITISSALIASVRESLRVFSAANSVDLSFKEMLPVFEHNILRPSHPDKGGTSARYFAAESTHRILKFLREVENLEQSLSKKNMDVCAELNKKSKELLVAC